MRMLALHYGADICYSPEIIDKRLIHCARVENPLGTIDYVDKKRENNHPQSYAIRIHPSERKKLVVQLGTACPDLAVQAAKIIEQDCVQIDVNCGCPKHFSIQGGMGAALLSNPDKLCSILSALVSNLSIPVSCKIRLLETKQDTISLIKRIASTGVSSIAIHCRTRDQRPREPADHSILDELRKDLIDIPVIVNGDVYTFEDVKRLSEMGINQFMVARGAQSNVSVFRELKGLGEQLPIFEVCREFLKLAVEFDIPVQVCKYSFSKCLFVKRKKVAFVRDGKTMEFEDPFDAVVKAKTIEELCSVFEVPLEARRDLIGS